MQYPRIVTLIDSRLALLRQVRELIALSCTSSRSLLPKPKVRKEATSRPVIKRKVIPADSFENGAALISTQPLRLTPVLRRERASKTNGTVVQKAASALTGNVPSMPVVISATQVRAAEVWKKSVATQPLPGNELSSFNAGQIARKWLQEMKESTSTTDLELLSALSNSPAELQNSGESLVHHRQSDRSMASGLASQRRQRL